MHIKHFIETHFGVVLVLSCVAGLAIPGLGCIPNDMVIVALALLMFLSCYKFRDGGFSSIRWRDVILFYGLRYIALPILAWAIAHQLAPAYATGVFLLTVVPAGVASPAFASIYGGTVPPAFAIVLLSQLAAPILIPLQFAWMGNIQVGISPLSLFIAMAWCIFAPMIVYTFARHHHRSAAYFYRQGKFFSMLLIAFVIGLAIAKQREIILSHGSELLTALVITLLCFASYIVFGWLFALHRPKTERITYAACSSFNNAALGVSLALLHFPPPVILFVAVSEISWSLLPFMFRRFLNWIHP